ncbi:MAG: AsmA family protein [Pseudomonadales bacterium]
MKTVFWAIIILMSSIIAGAFFLLENPDRFKAQISSVVASNSDYELEIGGELEWRYWPPIAIEVSDVGIAVKGADELARFGQMQVDVDLLPLLTQRRIIDINRMRLRDGAINLTVDAAGRGNWQAFEPDGPAPTTPGSDQQTTIPPTLHELQLQNITLNYIDAQSESEYRGKITSLQTSELAIGKPFDFSLAADLADADSTASFTASGRMIYRDTEKLAFEETVIAGSASTGEVDLPEFQITAAGEWHADRNALDLKPTSISLGTLRLTTSGLVNLAGSTPHYDGIMALESTDLKREASRFDLDIPITTLQFATGIYASAEYLNLTDLAGQFDNSPFTGRLRYSPGEPAALSGDIRLEHFNTADYLETTAPTPSASSGATPTDAPTVLIPAEELRTLQINLIARIRELRHAGGTYRNSKLDIENDTQTLRLIANTEGYGGRIVTDLTSLLDDAVTSNVSLTLDRLDLRSLTEVGDITGTLTGNSKLQFDGTRLQDLSRTLNGRSTFAVTDGTLNVTPIKQLAATIDQLRGKTSRVAEWPDIVPFDHMVASHVFSDGTQSGQVLTSQLENLHLTAQGGFDPIEATLRYDVTARFERGDNGRFSVSDELADVRWPLSCEGPFSASVTELCFGDDGVIRDLVADIVRQELKDRGRRRIDELIEDKVPDELKDLTSDLFKNLFNR